MVRIDLKDGIEYDDGKLNEASKFEGMDEIVNIGFTTAGLGDSEFFSLSMKNVNQGIEYGNLRAFFKTQVARILLFINHGKICTLETATNLIHLLQKAFIILNRIISE